MQSIAHVVGYLPGFPSPSSLLFSCAIIDSASSCSHARLPGSRNQARHLIPSLQGGTCCAGWPVTKLPPQCPSVLQPPLPQPWAPCPGPQGPAVIMSAMLYAHKFPPPSEATLMEWSVSFYFGGCTWPGRLLAGRQDGCICSTANEQTTACAS